MHLHACVEGLRLCASVMPPLALTVYTFDNLVILINTTENKLNNAHTVSLDCNVQEGNTCVIWEEEQSSLNNKRRRELSCCSKMGRRLFSTLQDRKKEGENNLPKVIGQQFVCVKAVNEFFSG